jgi:hypothetical protein
MVAWTATCMAHAADRALSEPKNHADALHTDHWKSAMDAKYSALIKNNTWQLVPPRSGINVIDSKWVFKVKKRSLMVLLSAIKPGLWLKVFGSVMDKIMKTLLVQLLNRLLFAFCYLLQCPVVGTCDSWIFRMLF